MRGLRELRKFLMKLKYRINNKQTYLIKGYSEKNTL